MMEAVHRVTEWIEGSELRAKLVATRRITPASSPEEVRELEFVLEGELELAGSGQILALQAPGSPEFGNEVHVRLYTIAEIRAPQPETAGQERTHIKLLVRRCSYLDEYSGERFPGVASNYLCDLAPGDRVVFRGPFPLPFEVPRDHSADLILIGSGTGIAPFRALITHIYRDIPDWKGRIWLFYGARTGLELAYMNDLRDDLAQYYDLDTFRALEALSPRPDWGSPIDWGSSFDERSEELWEMLGSPKTHVYLAGLENMLAELDRVLSRIAGSEREWQRRKAELQAGERWVELVY